MRFRRPCGSIEQGCMVRPALWYHLCRCLVARYYLPGVQAMDDEHCILIARNLATSRLNLPVSRCMWYQCVHVAVKRSDDCCLIACCKVRCTCMNTHPVLTSQAPGWLNGHGESYLSPLALSADCDPSQEAGCQFVEGFQRRSLQYINIGHFLTQLQAVFWSFLHKQVAGEAGGRLQGTMQSSLGRGGSHPVGKDMGRECRMMMLVCSVKASAFGESST